MYFMEQPVSNNHPELYLKNSDRLREFVIGMSDGLTVLFALTAGLSGAVNNTGIIVTVGIAAIVAGSLAMGLGGYFSGKKELEHYENEINAEANDVQKVSVVDVTETKEFFANIGLSEKLQTAATEDIAHDKKRWMDFLKKYELGPENPDPTRARKTALNIGLAYMVGGVIPISPYFFINDVRDALLVATCITLICLFVFGYFKSRLTGAPAFWGALKITLIGALAAAAAYGVAKLFE